MSDKGNKTAGCIGCLILIVIAGLIGWVIDTCAGSQGPHAKVDLSATQEVQLEQAKNLKMDAWTISKQFVKERLKSPSTADFQLPKNMDEIIWWKDNTFIVPVTVDAQNSFGAMIRQTFGTEVEYNGEGKWSLIDINQNYNIIFRKKMNTIQPPKENIKKQTQQVKKDPVIIAGKDIKLDKLYMATTQIEVFSMPESKNKNILYSGRNFKCSHEVKKNGTIWIAVDEFTKKGRGIGGYVKKSELDSAMLLEL